jgi:hypothetical protein
MIIFLTTDSKYKIGDDFPIFSIPVSMDGSTKVSLEDYQWWSSASDFNE